MSFKGKRTSIMNLPAQKGDWPKLSTPLYIANTPLFGNILLLAGFGS